MTIYLDEIHVGMTASTGKTVTEADILMYAAVSTDTNPTHLNAEFAAAGPFKERVAHGMLTAGLISAVLGTQLPGPGTVYRGQTIRYFGEIHAGDVVTITLTVTEKRDDDHVVLLDCRAVNQRNQTVMTGVAEVVAPTSHRDGRPGAAPDVVFHDHQHYESLIQDSRGEEAVPTAVAYPCEESALLGAVEADDAGIIAAILVGPEGRIRRLAETSGVSLEGIEIVDVPEVAQAAVEDLEDSRTRLAELLEWIDESLADADAGPAQ